MRYINYPDIMYNVCIA